MNSTAPTLFPMFLKLVGRRCVVVGGGAIAESKLESLLAAGATVTLVSPALTARLLTQQQKGAFIWNQRSFHLSDLDGAFLVIAATPEEATNELIFRESERRGILCNAVDQPPRCHFYFPAVMRRGALQIAISTAGLSPSLAHRLREEFEAMFPPEYGEWVAWLGAVREALMQRKIDFGRRKQLLAYVARRDSFERWRAANGRKRALGKAA